MDINIKVGDYVETVNGVIGYVTEVNDFYFCYEANSETYVCTNPALNTIKKFKRIGVNSFVDRVQVKSCIFKDFKNFLIKKFF